MRSPECSRCIKAKRLCEYSQGPIFILNDEGSYKTIYRKAGSTKTRSTPEEDPDQLHTPSTVARKVRKQAKVDAPAVSNVEILANGIGHVPSLVISALRECLFSAALCSGTKEATLTAFLGSSLGLCQTNDLCGPTLACWTLWRGRADFNPTLIDISKQLYTRGLVQTQRALMRPETVHENATLAACNALGLYEAIGCPDKAATAYRWHRSACSKLVHLRGPKAHRQGMGHRLFLHIRLHSVCCYCITVWMRYGLTRQILDAMEAGAATYLSSRDWMYVPWQIEPKNDFDELVDILTVGPELVQKSRLFPKLSGEATLLNAVCIIKHIIDIDCKLQRFYSKLKASATGPLYWEQVLPAPANVNQTLTFEPALFFHDLDQASLLGFYWAMLAMIWSGMTDLHAMLLEHTIPRPSFKAIFAQSRINPEDFHSYWLSRVRRVLQTVSFCTTPTALQSGPPRVTVALNIVIDTMKNNRGGCAAELSWAIRARDEIGSQWLHLLRYHLQEQ